MSATLPDPVIVAHRLLAVLGALILVAAAMVYGAPGTHAAPRSQATEPTITITDTLSTRHLSVAPGTTVTWVNEDSERHRMRSDEDSSVEFDSGNLEPGDRFSFTFPSVGDVTYHDHRDDENSAYFGMVMVEQGGGSGGGGSGGGSGGGGDVDAPRQAAVSIGDNFSPRSVTIAAGGTVTWTNNDGSPHTATGSSFDSGQLNGGQKYSHTFNKAGTYDYVCAYHDDMTGTIKVTNSSGEVPPGDGGGSSPPPPDNGSGGKAPGGGGGKAPGGGGGKAPGGGGGKAPGGGGGKAPGGGGGSKAPTKAAVTVGDDFFRPGAVTVAAGGTVTWTNTGGSPHTVTGSGWDSGQLNGGQKFSKTFKRAGTYSYFCAYHSDMTGTIKVTNSSGDVPARTPGGGGKSGGGGGGAGGGGAGGGGAGGGGAGGGGGGGGAPGAKTHTVTMTSDSFSPSVLDARVGDTVVWKNTSSVPHTVTGGPLSSGMIAAGQSYTTVLRQQGTISYKCEYHSGMTGTVKVAAAPAGTKLPPPSADTGVSGPSSGAPASTGSSSGPSGASAGAPAPGAESHTVTMVNSTFEPQVLQARVGDEVTWVNKDPVPHNVTGGPLDSGTIEGGASFTTVLAEAGTIEYECTLHPGMTGTLEVAEALPGTDIPPASSTNTSSSSGSGHAGHSEGSSPSAEPEAGAQNHTVNIVDFLYDPQTLEAHVGDTVTFVNQDAAPHTATATDDSFDSGNLEQGQRWTLKLEEVGTVEYLCTYHPDMRGTLVVKKAGEKIAPVTAGSAAGGADMADASASSAGRIAGFTSGWLALLAFLAGLQLQSRLASRRRMSNQA